MRPSNRTVAPSNRENDETKAVVGYMCMIDFEWELGAACGGNTVYPSVEDLLANHECAKSCGIVEVEVRFRKVIHEKEDIDWGDGNANQFS